MQRGFLFYTCLFFRFDQLTIGGATSHYFGISKQVIVTIHLDIFAHVFDFYLKQKLNEFKIFFLFG